MINILVSAFLLLGFAGPAIAQSADAGRTQTMRPVIRGRQAAVSSMRSQATETARQILEAGGNAFDAAVAGQAVPNAGIVIDPATRVLSAGADPRVEAYAWAW